MRLTLTGSLPGKLSSRPFVQQGLLAAFRAFELLGQLIVLLALGQRGFGLARMRGVEMLVLVTDLAVAGHVGRRGAGAMREMSAGFFLWPKIMGLSRFFVPKASVSRTRERRSAARARDRTPRSTGRH